MPSPFHLYAIAPWVIDQHQRIVSACHLPTYSAFGLFPDQKEIAVKGALFPNFILGIELVDANQFIVNSHVANMAEEAINNVARLGIPVEQADFSERIFDTGYIRWAQTDSEGKFREFDVLGIG